MYISAYNSSKITILNSVLIMMVLYIHSYYLEGEQYQGALAVQRFFGGIACCGTANRLFFFLSGILFFMGVMQVKDCFGKMKKRIKSLLIPYLIWNIIFVLWYVVLFFIPGVKSFVNSDIMSNFDTLWNGIKFLWIAPASFPLWFLRDLMCIVVLSPIIFLFIKYLRIWGVLLFLIVSLYFQNSGTFFVLGAAVSMLSSFEKLEKYLSLPVVIVSSILFVIACSYVCLQSEDYVVPSILNNIMAYTGMIMIWRGYDYIAKGRILSKKSFWYGIMGYSFFIYLFHEPTFNIIKKIPLRVLGDSEPVVIFFFLINPIIMAFVAIGIAKCLQKIIPSVYSVLVGGR